MSRLAAFGSATALGTLRVASRLVGAAVAALAVIAVGGAFLLSRGPVSVGFLTPYLQQALEQGGRQLEIADTVLEWRGREEGLGVRLAGVRLRQGGRSENVIELPDVHVVLSVSALLAGAVRPASIEIDGLKLRLVRERDGQFDLGLATEDTADGGLGDWLRQAFGGQGEAPLGDLVRLALRRADLAIEDRRIGRTFRAPSTELSLKRDGQGTVLRLTGAIGFGAQPIAVVLDARWRGGKLPGEASLEFRGLDPASVAELDPLLQPLAAVHILLNGRLRAAFDAGGLAAPVEFELAGEAGTIAWPERLPKPVTLRRLAARGAVALAKDGSFTVETLRLAQFELGLGPRAGLGAEGHALLRWSPAGIGYEGAASFAGLALKELELYWPLGFATNARNWVTANIQDGTVPEARVTFNLPPGVANPPRDAVLFSFKFDDVVARYLKPMPKITDGKGQASIDLMEFHLDLVSGRVGRLALSEGKLVIDGLDQRDQTADIQLAVTGPLPAGLELLDGPPLGFASKYGFQPAASGGSAAVRLRFNFPLEHWLKIDDVRFAVSANLSDVSLRKLFDRYDLGAGTVALSVNPKGLVATGKALLAELPIDFTWREAFGQPGAPSRYEASAVLDEAARARFGVAAAPYLAGSVPVTLTADVRRGGPIAARIEAQLAGAALRVDELAWRKNAGVPGRLLATLRTDPTGPVRIDDLALDAGDLTARGRLELDRDSGLRSLELTRLAYSDADLALRLDRDPRGNIAARVEAARIDLRRLLPPPDAKLPPGPRPVPGPVDLAKPRLALKIIRLDRLIVSDAMSFAGVGGELDFYGDRIGRIRASGRPAGGPPMTLELSTAGPRRQVSVTAGDAAQVAHALDLFDGAAGGSLDIKAEIRDDEPGGPLEGRLLVDDFRVIRAPILARILSLGSLTGIADLMNGNGIAFNRLELPFTALDNVFTVKEGRAAGAALGITTEGVIDRAGGRVDLSGTVVPAYTINSVLGNIPLLGTLLTGGKGEGVFAINYRVSGSLDEPSVSVNPLTALAPGFLRTILSALTRGKDAGPAPSDSPGNQSR